jgi:hypothetical protein
MLLDDIAKLEADLSTALPAVEAIFADLQEIADDLGVDVPSLFSHPKTAGPLKALGAKLGNTRFQNLVCLAIPIANALLPEFGEQITIPLPAFCGAPTPTPVDPNDPNPPG